MPAPTCRCCGNELLTTFMRHDVLVSRERPRPSTHHSSGRIAAVTCERCADEVTDCILRVAELWTPSQSCTHYTGTLFA